jgi:hypothetical protein
LLVHNDVLDLRWKCTTRDTLTRVEALDLDDLVTDRALAQVGVLSAAFFREVRAGASNTTRIVCAIIGTALFTTLWTLANLKPVQADARVAWRWHSDAAVRTEAIGCAGVPSAKIDVHAWAWRWISIFTACHALLLV